MAARAWTPAEVAQVDQGLAETNAQLDALLGAYRKQGAECGEDQALANLALALSLNPEMGIQGLFLVAVQRLARQSGEER
jgi:hypothetical protein